MTPRKALPDTMTAEEYQATIAQAKPHKYGAKAIIIDGHRFPSQAEGRRYGELRRLEGAGEIMELELQPRYPLIVSGKMVGEYRADFRYYERVPSAGHGTAYDWSSVVEDVKSTPTKTPVYRLKKKLMKAIYNIDIRELTA